MPSATVLGGGTQAGLRRSHPAPRRRSAPAAHLVVRPQQGQQVGVVQARRESEQRSAVGRRARASALLRVLRRVWLRCGAQRPQDGSRGAQHQHLALHRMAAAARDGAEVEDVAGQAGAVRTPGPLPTHDAVPAPTVPMPAAAAWGSTVSGMPCCSGSAANSGSGISTSPSGHASGNCTAPPSARRQRGRRSAAWWQKQASCGRMRPRPAAAASAAATYVCSSCCCQGPQVEQ